MGAFWHRGASVHVHLCRAAHEFDGVLERRAERQRELDRWRVLRANEADHARLAQVLACDAERSGGGFTRIALAPVLAREQVAELEPRPARRIEEADAPEQHA